MEPRGLSLALPLLTLFSSAGPVDAISIISQTTATGPNAVPVANGGLVRRELDSIGEAGDVPPEVMSLFDREGKVDMARQQAHYRDTQTSVSSLVSDVWNLNEDEYNKRVLLADADDILARWARRGTIPKALLEYDHIRTKADLTSKADQQGEIIYGCPAPDAKHKSCPAIAGNALPKAEVVVSAYDSNVSWLADLQMPVTLYVHNSSAQRSRCVTNGQQCVGDEKSNVEKLQRAVKSHHWLQEFISSRPQHPPIRFVDLPNVGDEALAYFSHIIANYNSLPDFVYFLHDHQCSWHAKFDMNVALNRALPCMAISKTGYLNLNDGPAGGPETPECYHTYPAPENTPPVEKHVWNQRGLPLARLWNDLFKQDMGELPTRYCMDCCAQFVVSRERIRSHSLEFYHRQLEAVKAGRTSFEYFWRMLFVENYN